MTKRALVGNAADPEQVQEATQQAKRTAKRLSDDLLSILNSPAGERFLWWLFQTTAVIPTDVFIADTNAMYFQSGKRQAGLDVLAAVMQADPTAFARMQANAIAQEQRDG